MPLMPPTKTPFISFVVPLYNHLEQTQAGPARIVAGFSAPSNKRGQTTFMLC
jgi:hypothetical protein